MCVYKMSPKELILTSGSSKGSQIKFLKDDYWYKIDETGPEGTAEEIASKILSFSSLRDDEYIKYETCIIEYEEKRYKGCRSKNFLNYGEQLFSYEKIYEMMTGRNLTEDIIPFSSPKERIDFVSSYIGEFSGLDVHNHIAKTLTADMILLNTDRHFNNFGIITNADQTKFRNAPIFDNGASFLSNYNIYPPSISIDDIANEKVNITGKPFSANLEYQAINAGLSIKFNFNKINEYLKTLPETRMKDILNYQIKHYENIQELTLKTKSKEMTKFSIANEMKNMRNEYFAKPKTERNDLIWNGEHFTIAKFEDKYLAQCKKEGIPPDENIKEHFWNNCVNINGYEPKFCKTKSSEILNK